MQDALAPFSIGWPVPRGDGLDDLARFLREPEFRSRFRLPGGQFALCERDERSGRAVAIRDPSATMPLHAFYDGAEWLISYSLASIERKIGRLFPLRLDLMRTLHRTLQLDSQECIYHGPMLLAPGVIYVFGANGHFEQIEIPIDWPANIQAPRDEWHDPISLAARAAPAVRTAVLDATGSTHAVVQQSGGLDSNLILHAGIYSGANLSAIGMTFAGLECDESEPMRASCGMLGLPFEPIEYAGNGYDQWKQELFRRAEYVPFTTAFMALEVAFKCREMGVSRLLSGMGGDEVFSVSTRAGTGFLARFDPTVGIQVTSTNNLAIFARGLVRRMISSRQRSLAASLQSIGWHFQMCIVQMLLDEGIEYRMPFRDWRAIAQVRPLAALHAAAMPQGNRGLQRALLTLFTPDSALKIGVTKAVFNDVGSAYRQQDSELGPTKLACFEGLIPDFIRAKRVEGREVL